MANTTNLTLPLIAGNQDQKHITHNNALNMLDAVVQMSVKDRNLIAPPGSPADGDRYIPAAGATGAWSGWDLSIAAYQNGAWVRYIPKEGWVCWVDDEDVSLAWDGAAWVDVGAGVFLPLAGGTNAFSKADYGSVVFTKTAAGTVSLKADTIIELAGIIYSFASATAVQMPSLSAGTDYAIYICNDGTVRADASFTSPSGFSTSTSRKIGGFHYAPGGNAAAQAGGDSIPAINEYSLWDIKWKPACPDPRGMALVDESFWCDIYLLGVNHYADGTSKYNVTIADGSSPPKVAAGFGGDGSATYSNLTWWNASECMQASGKDLLSYGEFGAAAYGITEATSAGSDPVTTKLDAARTSRWGVMQAAGNLWAWARDFSTRWDGAGGWAWYANTSGRGSLYLGGSLNLVAALLGGSWGSGSSAGSRASDWSNYPWNSNSSIGARGRCDHLRLV